MNKIYRLKNSTNIHFLVEGSRVEVDMEVKIQKDKDGIWFDIRSYPSAVTCSLTEEQMKLIQKEYRDFKKSLKQPAKKKQRVNPQTWLQNRRDYLSSRKRLVSN